jgi:hypothetical protein
MPSASPRWIYSSCRQSLFVCSTACWLWGMVDGRFYGLASQAIRAQAEWIANQITEACCWEQAPRYLIRDRDGAYGEVFIRRLRSMGIRDRPTSPRSPWQNGCVERLIRSIRRECLDHVVVFNERHLGHLLLSYMKYYNKTRTHPGSSLRQAQDSAAAHRGFSLGRCPGLHDPRQGSHLWRRRHTPIASHGHSGQTDCSGLTLAEWLCRTADRIDPARVFGPHHCLGRDTSAPDSNFLCRLLQHRQNPSGVAQGCADLSSDSTDWNHSFTPDPRRASPSVRPGLSFRYTQPAQAPSEAAE